MTSAIHLSAQSQPALGACVLADLGQATAGAFAVSWMRPKMTPNTRTTRHLGSEPM